MKEQLGEEMMGQWQEWVNKTSAYLMEGHSDAGAIERMREALGAIAEPMPDAVHWSYFTARGQRIESSGSLLDFAVGSGEYKSYPHTLAARVETVALGDALIKRGALPGPGMVEQALKAGLDSLDGPERLKQAFAWGAKSAWDPQQALATCAGYSLWDTKSGEACWEILIEQGALSSEALDFQNCPYQRHPLARAALEGDVEAVKRALKSGIPVDWRDPVTGATLWHLAGALSIPVGKELAPALLKNAPHLVDAVALANVVFNRKWGKPESSIRKGQTALHCACEGVKPLVASAALAAKADPSVVDSRCDTPLTTLSRRWGARAQKKAEPMIRELLAAGADPGFRDGKGRTAAQSMAQRGPLGALAELLKSRPEDVGGADALAKKAFEALSARGSKGLARAEEAAMSVESALASKRGAEPKKRRSSL